MKALAFAALAVFLACSLPSCSGDKKETKAAAPTEVTQPPKDVKPKMIDGKAVGFQ